MCFAVIQNRLSCCAVAESLCAVVVRLGCVLYVEFKCCFKVCLPLFIGGIGVGVEPPLRGFVEEAENPTPVGVGFGSPGVRGDPHIFRTD